MYKEGNIILRAMERKDLETSVKWVNDPEIALQINRFSPVSFLNHEKWFETNIQDKSKAVFSIETAEDKKYVGNCALINIDQRNQKAELWIYIASEFQGKGYGKNAVIGLLKYGFNKLNLNRIYLYVMDYNNTAINLYKKVGFEDEGICREDCFMDGKFHNSIRLAILRKNFK